MITVETIETMVISKRQEIKASCTVVSKQSALSYVCQTQHTVCVFLFVECLLIVLSDCCCYFIQAQILVQLKYITFLQYLHNSAHYPTTTLGIQSPTVMIVSQISVSHSSMCPPLDIHRCHHFINSVINLKVRK